MKIQDRLYKREKISDVTDEITNQILEGGAPSMTEEERIAQEQQRQQEEEERTAQEEEAIEQKEAEENAGGEEDEDDSSDENEDEGEEEDEETKELRGRFDELKEKKEDLTDEEKEEYKELYGQFTPLVNQVKDVLSESGYNLEGEYTDDTDGIVNIARDIAKTEVETQLQQLHETNPLLAEVYDHVVNKGLSEELFAFQHSKPEYQDINIKEESGQEQLAFYYYDKLGLSKEEANALIDGFKNQGNLDKKAKEFKGVLDKKREEEVQAREQQEVQSRKEQEEQSKKILGEIQQNLKKGTVNGYKIPQEDLKPFQEFIFGVDKEGRSVRDMKYATASIEQKMLIDYILMKDFDVPGIDLGKEIKKIDFQKKNKDNNSRSTSIRFKSGKKNQKEKEAELEDVVK